MNVTKQCEICGANLDANLKNTLSVVAKGHDRRVTKSLNAKVCDKCYKNPVKAKEKLLELANLL